MITYRTDCVKDEMTQVENRLQQEIEQAAKPAREMLETLLCGGKRLRPRLVILSALAVNQNIPKKPLIETAVGAELAHCASLLHDDVIDAGVLRRGRSTANALWGDKTAILLGDYLLARVFSIFIDLNKLSISRMLLAVSERMIASEISQSSKDNDIDYWKNNYRSVIRDKTASLMSICCRLGATLAEANKTTQETLAEYGTNIGEAFQITDDILDIFGDENVTGKLCGTDIVEGRFTLPVILALEMSDKKDELEKLLTGNAKNIEKIKEIIKSSGAGDKAYEEASNIARKAVGNLSLLNASIYKQALEDIALFAVRRKF